MGNIKGLKTQVLRILARDEQSRNSDIRLTQCIWYEFYREKLFQTGPDLHWAVKLNDLFDLPREDNIKRIRASIQNHPKNPRFLPTNEEVRKQRKINEETWLKYLNYNPEMRTV